MAYQPASANDLKFLIRSTLMANSTVSDLVGSEVHGAHIQDPDAGGAPYPLIVIDFQGGSVAFVSGFQNVTMSLWAYSRQSAGHAMEVYDAAFACLHHKVLRRDGVKVAGYGQEITRPTEGWNEKVRGYYATGLFSMRASYRETS